MEEVIPEATIPESEDMAGRDPQCLSPRLTRGKEGVDDIESLGEVYSNDPENTLQKEPKGDHTVATGDSRACTQVSLFGATSEIYPWTSDSDVESYSDVYNSAEDRWTFSRSGAQPRSLMADSKGPPTNTKGSGEAEIEVLTFGGGDTATLDFDLDSILSTKENVGEESEVQITEDVDPENQPGLQMMSTAAGDDISGIDRGPLGEGNIDTSHDVDVQAVFRNQGGEGSLITQTMESTAEGRISRIIGTVYEDQDGLDVSTLGESLERAPLREDSDPPTSGRPSQHRSQSDPFRRSGAKSRSESSKKFMILKEVPTEETSEDSDHPKDRSHHHNAKEQGFEPKKVIYIVAFILGPVLLALVCGLAVGLGRLRADQNKSGASPGVSTVVLQGPSRNYSEEQAGQPTIDPTTSPSEDPTEKPSQEPSLEPSLEPSIEPSYTPSLGPSTAPSLVPTQIPSETPTWSPSELPTSFLENLEWKFSQGPQIILFPPDPETSNTPTELPSPALSFIPVPNPTLKPSSSPTTTSPISPTGGSDLETFGQPPFPESRFVQFDQLTNTEQLATETLGYTERTWNRPYQADIEFVSYANIVARGSPEEWALQTLGFSHSSIWDCWVNHYNGFFWDELGLLVLPDGEGSAFISSSPRTTSYGQHVQRAFETLGWAQAAWDSRDPTQDPTLWNLPWANMSDKEQEASRVLCYNESMWNQAPVGPIN